MNNFESVLDDADSHQFLAVVPSVHHQRIGQTLHDGALCEELRNGNESYVDGVNVIGFLFPSAHGR